MGVEPILPASQAGVHAEYTTDTIDSITFDSSPTRIRTWNASLEAKHDYPFHHRAVLAFSSRLSAVGQNKMAWLIADS